MEKEKRGIKIQNIMIYYFICSVIGWIMEMVYGYMVFGKFVDRGFLYGPMCPIYGYGSITMVLIGEKIRKKNINIIGTFFIITIIFTLLEYIASLILESIFNLRWWDYTNEFLNLNGRVCLMFSLMFGIMGVFFIECIYEPSKRLIEKIREKISVKIIWVILGVATIICLTDTVLSVVKYVKL